MDRDRLMKMQVVDLRKLLKERGLQIKGVRNKGDIVDRIIEHEAAVNPESLTPWWEDPALLEGLDDVDDEELRARFDAISKGEGALDRSRFTETSVKMNRKVSPMHANVLLVDSIVDFEEFKAFVRKGTGHMSVESPQEEVVVVVDDEGVEEEETAGNDDDESGRTLVTSSRPIEVTVQRAPRPPQVVRQSPPLAQIREKDSLELFVEAENEPDIDGPLVFQWHKDDIPIGDGGDRPIYALPRWLAEDSGCYRCVVSSTPSWPEDWETLVASSADIVVNVAVKTRPVVRVVRGGTFELAVTGMGGGAIPPGDGVVSEHEVQPHEDGGEGQQVNEGPDARVRDQPGFSYAWQKDAVDIEGAVERQLRLLDVTLSDTGTYGCMVRSGDGRSLLVSVTDVQVLDKLDGKGAERLADQSPAVGASEAGLAGEPADGLETSSEQADPAQETICE